MESSRSTPPRRRAGARGGFLALAMATLPGSAQAPPDYARDALPALPGLLWEDARAAVAAPEGWDARPWQELGLGAGLVLATGFLLDPVLDRAAARNASPARDRLAGNLAQPGGAGGLVFMGAGYLGFSAFGQDQARSVVVDMGIATLLAQAAILPIKSLAGRARPGDNQGTGHFTPFSGADAFPSGHAAQAFAMASALAVRAPEPWVGWCAYGAAGLVGLARMTSRDHFASDVLGGALVGSVVGRWVAGRHLALRSGNTELKVQPAFVPGFEGLTLQVRF